MSTDSFDQILNRLDHLDREKGEDLAKLKKIVLSSSKEEITTILNELDLKNVNNVFKKLFKKDEKYMYEDVTDILNHILITLGANEFYLRFEDLIKNEILIWDCSKLKSIYLKLLLFCLKETNVQNKLINDDQIVRLIIENIADSDEEVGKRSVEILKYLATKIDQFLENHLFNQINYTQLEIIKNKNEITKFRYFEFIISLVLVKETFLQNERVQDGFKELLDLTCKSDDPLVVRNSLIIIDKLIEENRAVDYLEKFGYFNFIATKITNPQSDIFINLLMPGYLETFAKLGSTIPELVSSYQSVIDQIIEFILIDNFTSFSIESIGLIGRLAKGKLVLNSNLKFTGQCLPKFGQLLKYSQTQVEVLNCLSSLFDLNDLDATVEVSNILETWYAKLMVDRKKTTETIFILCKQVFPEIHLNTLNLICKLCKHEWGQKEFAQLNTFLDYVLNRNTEADYKSKEMKFKLITELATSPFTKSVFGPMNHFKIKKVHQEGAFYTDNDVSVATEGL